ncbi:MAG: hypothetical protein ACRC6X_05300 [Culicoidibacterales bacterium]
MKKIINNSWSKSIMFIMGILSILLLFSSVFTPPEAALHNGVEKQNLGAIFAEKKNSLEVLFLGDSESYAGFSPLQLWESHGIVSFNCGASSSKVRETYFNLRNVLEEQTPKVIVFETNQIFSKENLMTSLQRELEGIVSKHLPILNYHNHWKNFTGHKVVGKNGEIKADYLKGWRFNDRVKPYSGGNYMRQTEDKEAIQRGEGYYLGLIVKLAKQKNIEIIFVSAPSAKNWTMRKHNRMEAFAAKEGYKYLDLNLSTEQLGIDWKTDTFDEGDHINASGANKVTSYFGNWLKANYTLADYREDLAFVQWNIDLEKCKKTNVCP